MIIPPLSKFASLLDRKKLLQHVDVVCKKSDHKGHFYTSRRAQLNYPTIHLVKLLVSREQSVMDDTETDLIILGLNATLKVASRLICSFPQMIMTRIGWP